MMRTVRMVVVLGWMLAACGGDDGEGNDESPNKGEEDEKDDGKTLACGPDDCELPDELEGEELCCMDNFAGGCGVKVGESSCREIPDVDKRCPVPELMVPFPGGRDLAFGCCTSNGECGVDFGMGCQPRTVACMFVRPEQVDQIEPQTCDGEPLDLPANCGMSGIRIPLPMP